VRYELLGNVRVVDPEGASTPGARKIELLLAALLARANRVVTGDQLMEEIWGARLPRRATAGLHVYISELRKFLRRPERPEGPIFTRSRGYMLSLGEDSLDSLEFMDLVDAGRGHLRAGRHEEAADAFERGLALWRGPVFDGVDGGPLVRSFCIRLNEARTECTELIVDTQLQLGRHRELVGLLYTLTDENPLHEAFHRQLMLALYRSERRADALKVYESARRALIDELGVEPCPQLRDLHVTILKADDKALAALTAV
jgi:SARP family transcriptional regulator, regulator of embCAB operon